MALEVQHVPISFSKGVDSKSDSKQVLVGKLLVLENASLRKVGKFTKRFGYGVLNNSTALTNGNAIGTFKNELISFDGTNAYSYSSHDDKQYLKGGKLAVDLSTQSIVRNSYEQTQPDSAIHSSGISVYSWQDSSGGIRYSVFDTITGQSLVSNGVVSSTGVKPKVKAIGAYVLIFFYEGLVLKYFKVDTTLPTSSFSVVTLVTSGAAYFDVQLISTKLVVAYSDSASKTSLFSISTALVKSTDYQVNTPSAALSVFSDASNNVWVSYCSGNTVKYFITNFALSSTTLVPTTIESGSAPYVNVTGVFKSSNAVVFYEVAETFYPADGSVGSNQYTRKNTVTLAGSVGTASDYIRSVGLFSKAFKYNSNVYVVVTHQSILQSTYFLCTESGSVVAKIAPSLGGGLSSIGLLTEINTVSSNIIQLAFEFKDFVTSVNGDVTTQTGVNAAFLTFGDQIQLETIGNNMHMSGGIVSMYDGQNIVEKGFNLYPEDLSISSYSGGGFLGVGEYQYKAVYEWTDGQGQIHRSASSTGLSLDTNLNKLYSAGATSSTTFVPNTANSRDAMKVAPGFSISGPGLTGSQYLIYDFTAGSIQKRTTATGTSGTYILSSGKSFQASSTIGSKVITFIRQVYPSVSMNTTAGSTSVVLNNVIPLKVGTIFIFRDNGGVDTTAALVSQSGANVVLDTASPFTENSFFPAVFWRISGSVTAGSPVVTGVADTSQVVVGEQYYSSVGSATYTVLSKTSSTITMTTNFPSPGAIFLFLKHDNIDFTVGDTYSDISGSTFSGTVKIESISGDSITVDQQAAATTSTINFISSAATTSILSIPTLRVTDKKSPNAVANIGLYRTVKNGTVFYRVNPPSNPIINDTTTDYVSYVDLVSDDKLIGNEQLYTTGGEIENISPPASSVVGSYKNRLLLRNDEDKLSFWYSKKIKTNSPAEFTDSFVTRVPERGGDIVAFQQLDDKLIIFKQDLIFVQVGDGPADTGINNDFTDPQLITSDNGCINKKSIVLIPNGLIYQSSKGFYLLDRSLNMSYIGADVESYNSANVTSAKLMEDINQVRFTLDSGVVLVFDYYLSQWDVFPGLDAADSTVYDNKFTYILPSGEIRKENSTFTDDTDFVPMKLETGWMNLAGLQGYQRIYKVLILGEYKSPHSLYVEFFRDFNETAFQQTTIPVLTAPTGKYQYRVFLDIQKMESLKVRITELQAGPTYGEGMELSSIALEVGVKRGLNKLSEDESFG